MRITFLGAAQTVTGSCYLVETAKVSFLIDCGLFQGASRDKHSNRNAFPLAVEKLDFMLLSHAHIDHSGRIPKLWKDGFRSPIYATKATVDLCGLMLPDSGHIQEMEHEWRNRKNQRAGKAPELPLYTAAEATMSLQLFRPEGYGISFSPGPGINVIFRDAGHVLGSSIIELFVEEDGKTSKVVFSGDLGNTAIPIMKEPEIIKEADYLVIETTYGGRSHKSKYDKVDQFVDIVNETISAGGNVVIPSFAVGRTQEILYEINRQIAMENGADPSGHSSKLKLFLNTPVVVDSPLGVSVTEVFKANQECFDEEAQTFIRNHDNPLDFPNLTLSRSTEDSKAINTDPTPKIIIASSGMCDAGRIRHHLKHNLWRADSTILFVGYQAPGTLGRQLVDGKKEVRIFGEPINVNARVESISGYSGHADKDGLIKWISAMERKPKEVVLVHGEPESMQAFAEAVKEDFGLSSVMPEYGESVTLGEVLPEREKLVFAAADTRLPAAEIDKLAAKWPAKAGQASTKDGELTNLEQLQEEFLEVLNHFRGSLRHAENRRAREHAVARAREWERDVRRTLERYRRK